MSIVASATQPPNWGDVLASGSRAAGVVCLSAHLEVIREIAIVAGARYAAEEALLVGRGAGLSLVRGRRLRILLGVLLRRRRVFRGARHRVNRFARVGISWVFWVMSLWEIGGVRQPLDVEDSTSVKWKCADRESRR